MHQVPYTSNFIQCFGSVFNWIRIQPKIPILIQKTSNPDPSYFWTVGIWQNLNYFIIIRFSHQRSQLKDRIRVVKVTKKYNYVVIIEQSWPFFKPPDPDSESGSRRLRIRNTARIFCNYFIYHSVLGMCSQVILSACSPFFRQVLRRNPHQHPLLYLKGVKFKAGGRLEANTGLNASQLTQLWIELLP